MNIKYSSTLLGAALGLALLSAPAHGAVIVESSDSAVNTSYISTSGGSYSFSFGSFSLSGADKVVATIAVNHSGTPSSPITSVTYAGQAMTEAVGTGDGIIKESAIWYLDNPGSTTGDLVADMARAYGASATIWALSGTADGVGAVGSNASGNSTSLTTTAANSLVLAHATSGSGNTTIPTAESPLTNGTGIYNSYKDWTIGTGYETVTTAGSVTPSFDIGVTTVAAEFTAVPEPAAALFGGLALLALLRRRR